MRSNGGIIGSENIPTPETASGVWGLRQVYNAVTDEIWPFVIPLVVDYLLVAGGGGGNNGAGGAGGYIDQTSVTLNEGVEYQIVVGSGGAANDPTSIDGVNAGQGYNGDDTTFNSDTAIGGGGGGGNATANSQQPPGADGGSGGGGSHNFPSGGPGGSGTPGQGFDGGTGGGSSVYPGAAGGGASEVAGVVNVTGNQEGGKGGDGIQNSITGTAIYYAGGGGGHRGYTDRSSTTFGGSGGLGGGGSADDPDPNRPIANGDANTGGGGAGGSRWPNDTIYYAGNGGSGVAIIRTLASASATTGSPTVTTDGSYNIYTFTGSGSITF